MGSKLHKGDKAEEYGVNNAIEGRKIEYQGHSMLLLCGAFSYVCVFYYLKTMRRDDDMQPFQSAAVRIQGLAESHIYH